MTYRRKKSFLTSSENNADRIILAVFFYGVGLFLLLSLLSCIKNLLGTPLVALQERFAASRPMPNQLGTLGAVLSEFLLLKSFGSGAFFLPIFFFFSGLKLFFPTRFSFAYVANMLFFLMLWSSLFVCYFFSQERPLTFYNIRGEAIDFLFLRLEHFIGEGIFLLLVLSMLTFFLLLMVNWWRNDQKNGQSRLRTGMEDIAVVPSLTPPYKRYRGNEQNFSHGYIQRSEHARGSNLEKNEGDPLLHGFSNSAANLHNEPKGYGHSKNSMPEKNAQKAHQAGYQVAESIFHDQGR